MKVKAVKPRFPLVWRPYQALVMSCLFGALSITGLIGFFLDPTTKQKDAHDWFGLGFFLLLLLPSCLGVVYSLRTKIEADEDGIRWRSWRGPWKSVRWEEVSDYWRVASNGDAMTIETPIGNVSFNKEFQGQKIAALVAERATQAKFPRWAIKGERPCDVWPRRFDGWLWEHVWVPVVLLSACLVITALFIPGWAGLRYQLALTPPIVWFMAYVGPYLLALLVPLLLLVVSIRVTMRAFHFRDQSYELDPDGLTWFHAGQSTSIRWEEIEKWEWQRVRKQLFLVAQTNSIRVLIPHSLPRFHSLCRIIENFRGTGLVKMVGDLEASRCLPERNSEGDFVFRQAFEPALMFRSLGAVYAVAPSLASLLVMLVVSPDDEKSPDPLTGFGLGLLGIAMLIAFEWWVRSHWIQLTHRGLETHGPGWNRSVLWENIESFGNSSKGNPQVTVGGEKITLSRWIFSPNHRSLLRSEIERRAINAQGSWEKLEQNGRGSE